MTKPTIPSAQHLARIWQPTVKQTFDSLVRLAENPPAFSYGPLLLLVHDLIVFRTPLDQLEQAIRGRVKHPAAQSNYLELLSLIYAEFARRDIEFALSVAGRRYPLSRELAVPFVPPLVYGSRGELVFPWFSLWRSNPLVGERLSLFVTLVHEMLMQDPDLENARFEIWDLSAPATGEQRRLVVTDASEIRLLDAAKRTDMLSVFVEAFRLAREHFASHPVSSSKQPRPDSPTTGGPSDDLFR